MSKPVSAIVIMGVSGSGKTTAGRLLARELGWSFYDADDFQPQLNIAKMTRGEPLDDADREPWLEGLRALLDRPREEPERLVLACSALKERYRRKLGLGQGDPRLVYIKGSFELIAKRMRERTDHFMKEGMLRSQFAALEEPVEGPPGEGATLVVDASATPEDMVRSILLWLQSAELGS
ncbi:MAG TPA: gluconokinase [Polyangiaceae bacterium]|jgi:gluconokinase